MSERYRLFKIEPLTVSDVDKLVLGDPVSLEPQPLTDVDKWAELEADHLRERDGFEAQNMLDTN
ncbi:MAG TPA: hypothetical protein VMR28_03665 [Candidatus Saccharimonadales bacterium]|nr:hypothetical protein [Candidatus Saccharimonadales bacterium]